MGEQAESHATAPLFLSWSEAHALPCLGIGERRFLSIIRLAELEVALIDLMEASVFGDILAHLSRHQRVQ